MSNFDLLEKKHYVLTFETLNMGYLYIYEPNAVRYYEIMRRIAKERGSIREAIHFAIPLGSLLIIKFDDIKYMYTVTYDNLLPDIIDI